MVYQKIEKKPFIQAVFYYTWRPIYLSQRKFLACWRKSKLQSKEWYLKSSFEVHFGKIEKLMIGTRLRQACPKTPNSLLGKWHLSFFLSFNSWSLEAFSSTGAEKWSFRGVLKQNNNLLGLVHTWVTTTKRLKYKDLRRMLCRYAVWTSWHNDNSNKIWSFPYAFLPVLCSHCEISYCVIIMLYRLCLYVASVNLLAL